MRTNINESIALANEAIVNQNGILDGIIANLFVQMVIYF